MKSQINIRASDLTTRQLEQLTKQLGTSITETVSIAIDRMYQQETDMSNEYNVWASNDQGATTTVSNGETSIRACESMARATLGSGWTVHIDKVLRTSDGEHVGREEVKSFRIR